MMRDIIFELPVGEDIMIGSTILMFLVGEEDNMIVSITLSRHTGMTCALLEMEVTERECTMISGLRSRSSTFLTLMEDTPKIG